MTPGRFSLGMTVAILALGGTALAVEFGYLSAFRSYLVGEHGLRLGVMSAAAFLGVAGGAGPRGSGRVRRVTGAGVPARGWR